MSETKPEAAPAAPLSVVLTEDLFGCDDTQVHPVTHPAGKTVTGSLAEAAIALGKAPDPRPAKKPPANKSAPGAPETKG